MNHFQRKAGELWCEEVRVADIAEKVGTPVYIYSRATLDRHYHVFDEAMAQAGKHLICYSVKANPNLAVLKLLASWGAGFDTVSRGEIYRAIKAGADPKKIVFSGVGKRDDEIEYALDVGILAFNVESHAELEAIERVAAAKNKKAPISLRLNPDVDPETHPYISTGLKKNKFGIPMTEAKREIEFAKQQPHLEVVGLDCHIGSQLTKTSPFEDAIRKMAELAKGLIADGAPIKLFDIGGGLGIPYNDEQPPSPESYAGAIKTAIESLAGLDVTVVCEPGRVIVGNAGILVTKTLYLKQNEAKSFVIVDAAMNDLIRPALYESFHAIEPVASHDKPRALVTDVVGPICETGDFFARDRKLTWRPSPGDLVALMSAGAYGFSMASNYNTRPRPAEVLVEGDQFRVIRQRETLDDLLRGEQP